MPLPHVYTEDSGRESSFPDPNPADPSVSVQDPVSVSPAGFTKQKKRVLPRDLLMGTLPPGWP